MKTCSEFEKKHEKPPFLPFLALFSKFTFLAITPEEELFRTCSFHQNKPTIKPFKIDQHNPDHFRFENWRSLTGVNLYSSNTLNQRQGLTVELILRYFNLTTPKNQKIMGKPNARTWTSNYLSSIPFLWWFCHNIQKIWSNGQAVLEISKFEEPCNLISRYHFKP